MKYSFPFECIGKSTNSLINLNQENSQSVNVSAYLIVLLRRGKRKCIETVCGISVFRKTTINVGNDFTNILRKRLHFEAEYCKGWLIRSTFYVKL